MASPRQSTKPRDLEQVIEADGVQLVNEVQESDDEIEESVVNEEEIGVDMGIGEGNDGLEDNGQQDNMNEPSNNVDIVGTSCGGNEDAEILPYIGMRFDDLNLAYSFYMSMPTREVLVFAYIGQIILGKGSLMGRDGFYRRDDSGGGGGSGGGGRGGRGRGDQGVLMVVSQWRSGGCIGGRGGGGGGGGGVGGGSSGS
ncbi:keratin, type I cytoskeletal 9-like [Macadamia integrifolia]|uniref:keratin, type I cytoskeletal 9-like n=1 Tax=Macadamia integrifolia TaxID=60698 RepID=UPI001C4E4274|nr:keratin, type I cytoskeletal 9-like [Macadamia integrifolia]